MGKLHGFVMVLVIFERIKIQCEGTTDETPPKKIQDLHPTIARNILSRLDFQTVKNNFQFKKWHKFDIDMKEWLRDRIVIITTEHNERGRYEFQQGDDKFIQFKEYASFLSFFMEFGDKITRIKICATGSQRQPCIIPDPYECIKKAEDLEELRIIHGKDESLWEQLSNERGKIFFPKVKKFHYSGKCNRNEFKFNLMFPELKSLKLYGTIKDKNCLANIKTLEELELFTASIINEDQLISIFANNENLKKIILPEPKKPATMEAIAKYLKNLKSLVVIYPGRSFLLQMYNLEVYNLSSVMNFTIIFDDLNFMDRNLLFNMPNLKNLKLIGNILNIPIFTFISRFNELKRVELISMACKENMDDIKKKFEDSAWNLSYPGDNSCRETLVFEREVST